MIDFRLLRHFWYFLAVADEQHFGRAAKRLGMSQPLLSQQIQVLEQLVGVRLFERSRHGARLTREGAAILGTVQRFMEHAQRLQVAVNDARQGRSDVVTIGAISSALFDVMPRLMRIAKQRYPHLSLSMCEMKSAEALSAVKDLADETFVLPPRRSSPSYFDRITSACRAVGFSPRVHFEVSSVVSQIAYVGCGVAIGMVPSGSMRFGGSDVVFRPLIETIDVVNIAAAWNPQRRKDLVPEIVEIAANIDADRGALPIRTEPMPARAG